MAEDFGKFDTGELGEVGQAGLKWSVTPHLVEIGAFYRGYLAAALAEVERIVIGLRFFIGGEECLIGRDVGDKSAAARFGDQIAFGD